MLPSKKQIDKVASSLKCGIFDFEVIAQYRTDSPFWGYLEKLNGTPIQSLGKTQMWQFSLALVDVLGIEMKELVERLGNDHSLSRISREAAWIKALRRLNCTLQDIPEAERTLDVCRQAIKNNAREFCAGNRGR